MRRRSRFAGRTALVTGAAGGLGLALCHRLVAAGARVGAVDRRAAALQRAAADLGAGGATVATAVADLADAAATRRAAGEIRVALGPVDLLVANAGITRIRRFATGEEAAVRRLMEVNFLGAVHAAAAVLDDLRARRGTVVVISSVAGFAPLLGRSGYCASKHALHGFFDTLRLELAPDGVDVLLVCPSFIATGLRREEGRVQPIGAEAGPEAVADRIVRAAERRRRFLAVGRVGRLAWWLHRLAPRLYERLMLARIDL